MLLALALVVATIPLAAQGRQGGQGDNMQRQNEMLLRGITLTEAQQAQVDSIQATTRQEMRTLMQSGGMGDPATREQAMALRTKSRAEIRKVLTEAQQVVFDKNVAELPQMGPARTRPPRLR
jgi:Spy/CpxP family protein refolding chaperone